MKPSSTTSGHAPEDPLGQRVVRPLERERAARLHGVEARQALDRAARPARRRTPARPRWRARRRRPARRPRRWPGRRRPFPAPRHPRTPSPTPASCRRRWSGRCRCPGSRTGWRLPPRPGGTPRSTGRRPRPRPGRRCGLAADSSPSRAQRRVRRPTAARRRRAASRRPAPRRPRPAPRCRNWRSRARLRRLSSRRPPPRRLRATPAGRASAPIRCRALCEPATFPVSSFTQISPPASRAARASAGEGAERRHRGIPGRRRAATASSSSAHQVDERRRRRARTRGPARARRAASGSGRTGWRRPPSRERPPAARPTRRRT